MAFFPSLATFVTIGSKKDKFFLELYQRTKVNYPNELGIVNSQSC